LWFKKGGKINEMKIEKKKENINSYSGGMYPNVPARRVCNEELPYSDSFASPKSATCTKISWINKSDFRVYHINTSFLLPFHGSSCLLIYLLI
jgi:hypothetical protein